MNSISKNSPETALNTNPNNFNARKFGKYATQCGLSSMECPWPADVGVLSTMSSKMTQGLDRAGYTALFNHMAQQTAIEVLGLKNMVAQARYHGMTAITMFVGAMKECPNFGWGVANAIWPTEYQAFVDVVSDLRLPNTQQINPWGEFGIMAEKNVIRATQFKRLSQLAYDVQVKYMGNTSIQSLASYGTRAIYGKWGQVVDNLMADYDNWLTTNNTVTALAATIPATHAASIQLVRGLTFD